jgi:TRAP transporter TAXI family solute receptor
MDKNVFTIGSGSPNAMYFPVASAICETYNKFSNLGYECSAELSKGADFNLISVENGGFDFGITQESLFDDSKYGIGKFSKPHQNLDKLFGLHYEYLTIIAKKDSEIKQFSDLFGKSVNVGNFGSGSKILFEQMIDTYGKTFDDFKNVYYESGSDIKKVLCAPGKADAAVYIVGHPNQSFDDMLRECDTHFISLPKEEISKFLKISPDYFFKTQIDEGLYFGQQKTDTFAVGTVLFVSKKINKEIVADLIDVLNQNKNYLIGIQPSLEKVDFKF